MTARAVTAGLIAAAFLVAGCAREEILPGERFDVTAPLDATAEPGATAAKLNPPGPLDPILRDVAFPMPAQVNHTSWTHRGGTPTHWISHPALGSGLTKVWSASIGAGDSRRYKVTADPIVAEGRIFTLDSRSQVMAHSTGGATLWSQTLVPPEDRARDASGGGLAFGGGKLFVTTGFGLLMALNPANGQVLWTQNFDSPVAGSPTVVGDLVYVSSRDNRGFAVRTDNGRLQWELTTAPTVAATINGSGPAVDNRIAVFPFGSSELVAALRLGGVRVWGAMLAGQRRGFAFAGIGDISADPVIVNGIAYAGSPAGRIAAINVTSGERIWTATEGAMSPVWVEGGSVFAVTDLQQLARLDAKTGEVIWRIDMPRFKKERPRKRRDVFAHYGPVLAGGRLIVASDDGYIRSFNPRNGALISTIALPGGATTNPVVVDRTLYVVTTAGQLVAFR
ncbi:PQQ-like beta-propeller repeat protein [Tropicimonas sp. IMCC34043]|uniref:PQQ-like beta-propeller repeat protein n=1 Tax=Tropicimonas sp. IMCC34043 TaxID=2248760 RepID=UPI0018E599E4|nr:PQQ-like beta-propeller repeat protein [Tropicimonas sp. IMCC34043]